MFQVAATFIDSAGVGLRMNTIVVATRFKSKDAAKQYVKELSTSNELIWSEDVAYRANNACAYKIRPARVVR